MTESIRNEASDMAQSEYVIRAGRELELSPVTQKCYWKCVVALKQPGGTAGLLQEKTGLK